MQDWRLCGERGGLPPLPHCAQCAHSDHWCVYPPPSRSLTRNHNAPFPARAHLHPDATRLVVRAQDFVPRMGYLPAMIAKVMESFRSAVVDGWEEQDVWFDHCGHPLKWYGVTGGGQACSSTHVCVRPFFPWCMKVHPCMCIVVRIVVHEEADIALPT